jgi:flavin-dependent dehydrogenase
MKTIRILGAGISGLTAAINLAKEGYDVEVLERFSDVGEKYKLNFEGLENWTTDIMKLLKKINIKANFKNKGFNEVTWYSPSFRKAILKDKTPFFYLVERGGKNSLEYSLKKQALDLGIRFIFNSKSSDANIISVGARKPMAFGFGTFYENVDFKDSVIGILSNKIAPSGYFYIHIWNKRATVCTTTRDIKNIKDLRNIHKRNLKIDICRELLTNSKEKHEFSGFVNYNVPISAFIDGRIYTGEAAGFQDAFLGFGMKYAFLSGYFAAKSIIDNLSYDELWKKCFKNELKRTLYPRFYISLFGDRMYEKIIKFLQYNEDHKSILKSNYCNNNWKSELIYSIYSKFILIRCKNLE